MALTHDYFHDSFSGNQIAPFDWRAKAKPDLWQFEFA
jgi:hypothetical protein